MKKVAIVILNYLNYQDTIECVESIKKMAYSLAGIVIVDNGSNNDSYKILSSRYKHNKGIAVIRARRNYGFAKGNNIGITYARKKYKTDYIYVVNNDVVFMQKDYFKKLLEACDGSTGLVGSKIMLKNHTYQECYSAFVSVREVLIEYVRQWLISRNKSLWICGLPEKDESKRTEILHGCGILFTPAFFKRYRGFYPKTFLYCEEEILYMMCQRFGLQQKYVDSTYLYHKEDQSSEMSFQNDGVVRREYVFDSYKYVVWWALTNSVLKYLRLF